jgi:hypothetical protein
MEKDETYTENNNQTLKDENNESKRVYKTI